LGKVRWELFDWIKNPEYIKDRFGKIDILLIDSYLAPEGVYEFLHEVAKVPAYYDDFRRIEYPCGIIVNGNIHAEEINYPEKDCSIHLLGTEYLPLRKEFWEAESKRIMETFTRGWL